MQKAEDLYGTGRVIFVPVGASFPIRPNREEPRSKWPERAGHQHPALWGVVAF